MTDQTDLADLVGAAESVAAKLRADPVFREQCQRFAKAIHRQPSREAKMRAWRTIWAAICTAYLNGESSFQGIEVDAALQVWDSEIAAEIEKLDRRRKPQPPREFA
jgi:hypothetical protein